MNTKNIYFDKCNEEMKELYEEIESLTESFIIVSNMVVEQGEKIDIINNVIEETNENLKTGVVDLEKANNYTFNARKNIKNAVLVLGGLSFGFIGFIGGPLIGIGTTVSGLVAGIGLIAITERKR